MKVQLTKYICMCYVCESDELWATKTRDNRVIKFLTFYIVYYIIFIGNGKHMNLLMVRLSGTCEIFSHV